MSSELTPELELFKAVPGSGEPFRTSDLNDNADKLDAFAATVLAPNFVTRTRIATGAVGSGQLDTYSVVSSKIAPESVTSAELASNSVGADELQPNSVGASELQSNSVIESKLASGSVSDAKLQGGLNASKLAFGTLNPSLLPDGGVSASKLASVLNLTSNGVYVPDNYDTQAAASVSVVGSIANAVVDGDATARNTPAKFAYGAPNTYTTSSTGLVTVNTSGFGFFNSPMVTATIINPVGTAGQPFMVALASNPTPTSIVFKVVDAAGAVCNTKPVTFIWLGFSF